MSTVVDAMIYVYDPKQLDRHVSRRPAASAFVWLLL